MDQSSEEKFEAMCRDPAHAFERPQQVLDDAALSADQKIKILVRWEQDCRELEVAEEEGMAGGETGRLDEVRAALKQLPEYDDTAAGASKHGGGVEPGGG